MISTEMNVDEVIVKNEPICYNQDYLPTTEIKAKKIKQEVKQEPIDSESQTSSSQNESTSKDVVVKSEEEEEETAQTISIAFLNETTTQNETTTNEKSK